MKQYQGRSVFQGMAAGTIRCYARLEQKVKRIPAADTNEQLRRYEEAKWQAAQKLRGLYEKAMKEAGMDNAAIFEVQAMMLEDEHYNDTVRSLISGKKINAEYAVYMTGDKFSRIFAEMDDEYFKAREMDVRDITKCLLQILGGYDETGIILTNPVILACQELAPSELIHMDRNLLLGIILERGSVNSHTAILARSMNIPMLTGISMENEWEGKIGAIDGFEGKLLVEPDREILLKLHEMQQEQQQERKRLEALYQCEDITKDGVSIPLYANIRKAEEVNQAVECRAAGIGLFRTEFLYLEKDGYPTEEEQFQVYKEVVQRMDGKPVVIRTIDIGADKKAPYFGLESEENPAMGYRAIRLCLNRIELFKTQIRAILRASMYGDVAIMYPMIISESELMKAKQIFKECEKELDESAVPYKKIEQGIMIETPAAVMISDLLAKQADFFSIGTNDLTQYTLAVDRQNAKLDGYYDEHHPAIMRMIELTIKNAHSAGIKVSLCGELATDPVMIPILLKMGMDALSVSPSSLFAVRKEIRECVRNS